MEKFNIWDQFCSACDGCHRGLKNFKIVKLCSGCSEVVLVSIVLWNIQDANSFPGQLKTAGENLYKTPIYDAFHNVYLIHKISSTLVN